MTFCVAIYLAFLLDLLLGDPRWIPHPVRLMGRFALFLEKRFRRLFRDPGLAGTLTALTLLATVLLTTAGFLSLAAIFSQAALFVLAVVFLYTTLALRDLLHHTREVYRALKDSEENLDLARQKVAMIVGRDTTTLDGPGIVRACVESVAENMADGVIAPLFWSAVAALAVNVSGHPQYSPAAGAVGGMFYKAINTMDSMFGYKNERYLLFGRFAARLDDLANWLPARLTALLIIIAAWPGGGNAVRAFITWRRDHHNHTSPNAGHPEAAMAGALSIQLGGPSVYFGQAVEKPTLGEPLHTPSPQHIRQANRIVFLGSLLAVFATGILFLLLDIS
ncbi:adenosylcobinamide-phosphate synthase CbiB [Desulfolithobacter sp.]